MQHRQLRHRLGKLCPLRAEIRSAGIPWFTAVQNHIAPFGASFDGGLNFTSALIFLSPVSTDLFRGIGVNSVCGPTLVFDAGADGEFVAMIGSNCSGQFVPVDTATYAATAVPEPGTLALILGGVGAGWLRGGGNQRAKV